MAGLGRRIASARNGSGMFQRELAEKIGVTEGAVRQYEAGKITPRMPRLEAIAGANSAPVR